MIQGKTFYLDMLKDGMRNFGLWLAGADSEVLTVAPREAKRVAAMGSTVGITGGMAFFSGVFTANDSFQASVPIAVIAGLVIGTAVVVIDRMLLIWMRRQDKWYMTILHGLPRLLLALLIGLAISKSLMLRMFDASVTARASDDNRQALRAEQDRIDKQYSDIDVLEKQEQKLTQRIAVGVTGVTLDSPLYVEAKERLTEAEQELDKAKQNPQCEASGECRRLQGRVQSLRERLGTVRGLELNSERRKAQISRPFVQQQLEELRKKIVTRKQSRADDEAHASAVYSPANLDYLDRIEALGHLSDENVTVRFWNRVFLWLIVAIDTLAVAYKLLSLLGKESVYERVQNALDERDADWSTLQLEARKKANEIEAQTTIDEAEQWRRHVDEITKEGQEQAAAILRAQYNEILQAWADKVRAWVANAKQTIWSPHGNGTGPGSGGGRKSSRPRGGSANGGDSNPTQS